MNCTKQYWSVPHIQGCNTKVRITDSNEIEVMELFIPASMYVKNAQTFSQIQREDCSNLTSKYVLILQLMLFMSQELFNDSDSNSSLSFENIKNVDGTWAGYRIRLVSESRIKLGRLLHALFVHNHQSFYTIRNRNPQLKKLETQIKQVVNTQQAMETKGIECHEAADYIKKLQDVVDLIDDAAVKTWVQEDNLPVLTTLQSTKQKSSIYQAHPFQDPNAKPHLQDFERCTLEIYIQAVETLCGYAGGVRLSQDYTCLDPDNYKNDFYPTQAFSVQKSMCKASIGQIDPQFNQHDYYVTKHQFGQTDNTITDSVRAVDAMVGRLDLQNPSRARQYEQQHVASFESDQLYLYYKHPENVYTVRREYFSVYTYQDFVFPFAESFEMDNTIEQKMFFDDLQYQVDPSVHMNVNSSDPATASILRRLEAARFTDQQDGDEDVVEIGIDEFNMDHRRKRRKLINQHNWRQQYKVHLSLRPNKSSMLTYYTLRTHQNKLMLKFSDHRQVLDARLAEIRSAYKEEPTNENHEIFAAAKVQFRQELYKHRRTIQREGIDYFKRIFHKDGMVPDAHRACARWFFDYLDTHDQKIGLVRYRLFKNLSVYHDSCVVRLIDYEITLEAFSCHRDIFLSYLSVIQNYRGRKFKLNMLHSGDAGAGKSFLMELILNSCIENTSKGITYATIKSKTAANTNHSAMIEVYQEAQPGMLGIQSGGKSSGGGASGSSNITSNTGEESMIKTQLTEGFIMVQEMVFDDNHVRVLKETKVLTDILVIVGTNSKQEIPQAIVDRFVKIAWTEQLLRVTAQASLKSNPSKLQHCKTIFETRWRRNQALACIIGSMIDIGILCEIDMSVARAFHEKVQEEALKQHLPGFGSSKNRNRQRYEMIVEGIVIDRVIDMVFDFMPYNDEQQSEFSAAQNQPFDFERILDLEPHLYSRTEDCILGFGLMAQQYEDFSQYSVLESLKTHFFDKQIKQCNTVQSGGLSGDRLSVPGSNHLVTPNKARGDQEALITADADFNVDLTLNQNKTSRFMDDDLDDALMSHSVQSTLAPSGNGFQKPTTSWRDNLQNSFNQANPGVRASPRYGNPQQMQQPTMYNYVQPHPDDYDEFCYVINLKDVFKSAKSNRDEERLYLLAQIVNDKIQPKPKFEETFNVLRELHTKICDYDVERVAPSGQSESIKVRRAVLSFSNDNVVMLKSVFKATSKEQLKDIVTRVAHYEGAPTQRYLYGRTHIESPMLWQSIEVDTRKWVNELKQPLYTFDIRNPNYFDSNLQEIFESDKPELKMSFSEKIRIKFQNRCIDDWGMHTHHHNICLGKDEFKRAPNSSTSYWRSSNTTLFNKKYPEDCRIDNQYMAKVPKSNTQTVLCSISDEASRGNNARFETLDELVSDKFIDHRSPRTLKRANLAATDEEPEDEDDDCEQNLDASFSRHSDAPPDVPDDLDIEL